jgi:hypothetical protein
MVKRVKFPKIPHLPWSPSRSTDDISLDSTSMLERLGEVVVTEKMDGENTSLYHDFIHARSVDFSPHPSRSWIKSFHATMCFNIPTDLRICGENLYAKHSIFYDLLPSYFLTFSIFRGNTCLSWDETTEWCDLLGLETIPVMYRGEWNMKAIQACMRGESKYGSSQEGYVVRSSASFELNEFPKCIGKYVREGHVQTDQHWLHSAVIPNRLAKE